MRRQNVRKKKKQIVKERKTEGRKQKNKQTMKEMKKKTVEREKKNLHAVHDLLLWLSHWCWYRRKALLRWAGENGLAMNTNSTSRT